MADEANGVVLISANADDKCMSFSTFLSLHAQGDPYKKHGPLIPVDVYAIKSDFSDSYGFVSALAVPAGNYYFSPWLANSYFIAKRAPRFDFSVAPGEVVYLGEYHQPGRCVTGEGVVTNKWERDREKIAIKNPDIDLSNVSVRILRYSGDAVTGEDAPPADRYDEIKDINMSDIPPDTTSSLGTYDPN